MGYVIAAAILALLVIGFTRKTVVVLAGLVALAFVSVAIYLGWDSYRQHRVADRNAALVTTIAYDAACGPGGPLRMTLQNTARRRLDAVRFDLAGYREGHSIPLYRTRGVISDRILAPGEAWEECFPLAEPIRGTDTRALAEVPPATLRWQVEGLAGTFAR